jgi:UDP-3-O-[3-hydroxymyristoyl] glucosamine N-acyltransferase
LKLRDIADQLHCRLEGDGDVDIVRIAAIHKAGAGDLTFVSNARYLPELATTRASAVILGRVKEAAPAGCAVLRTDDPYTAFAHAVSQLRNSRPHGPSRTSCIARLAFTGYQ